MIDLQHETTKRCGFIAILGVPNAGKSTLVNALVGSKVSIVSHKVQTTRRRVLGIAMHEQAQIILIDTPGIFIPQRNLEKAMVRAAWQSIDDVDMIIVVIDASAPSQQTSKAILAKLQHSTTPISVAFNKVDLLPRKQLLPLAQSYAQAFPFIKNFFMISATRRNSLDDMLNTVVSVLPKAEWIYPEDQLTDLPMRLWAAELTREKVYRYLHEELPYAIHVETEVWEQFDNGSIKIMQTIHVKRDNQKAIVLGKGGQMLRKLGEVTRMELKDALECNVHLMLNVRVTPNWADDAFYYQSQGLEK